MAAAWQTALDELESHVPLITRRIADDGPRPVTMHAERLPVHRLDLGRAAHSPPAPSRIPTNCATDAAALAASATSRAPSPPPASRGPMELRTALRPRRRRLVVSHDFDVPDRSRPCCRLCFDGLATLAEVWLNGQLLLTTDNMFRGYRVDVAPHLRAQNELVLGFRSLDRGPEARSDRGRAGRPTSSATSNCAGTARACWAASRAGRRPSRRSARGAPCGSNPAAVDLARCHLDGTM